MNVDKFIRDTVEAVDHRTDNDVAREEHHFGGKPGTAVPEVNPEHLKAVWDCASKLGPGGAIDTIIFERHCKPGADVQAICYRWQMLGLVSMMIQTQQLTPNADGTLDMKVF